jgi:hypothetical protein
MFYALQMRGWIAFLLIRTAELVGWERPGGRAHMGVLTFIGLSLAACAFLVYAFVHFNHEVERGNYQRYKESR